MTLDNRRCILYVSSVSEIGGAELSLLELVRTLPVREFRAVVALPRRGALASALRERNITVRECAHLEWQGMRPNPLHSLSVNAIRALSSRALLSRIARTEGVDLIHANSSKAGFHSALVGMHARLPVLWHVRDQPARGEVALLSCVGGKPIAISRALARTVERQLRTKCIAIENGGRC